MTALHELRVAKLYPDAQLLTRSHAPDAGADLYAYLPDELQIILEPGERQLIGTGIAMDIPEGFAGFVHPRSGTAVKTGLSIVNSPGTIDAGYTGELKIGLINTNPSTGRLTDDIIIKHGQRIGQLIIQRVETPPIVEITVEELRATNTKRGAAGFGSTGQ